MGQLPLLKPISKTTVTDMIVERLTNYIIDTGMKPGDKLPSERELMEQLSVGRSSLREAIKILETIGVIEVFVGEGMYVSQGDSSALAKPLSWSLLISEASIREVMEARRMIEIQLAQLAAERASDEQVAALGKKLEELRSTAEKRRGANWDLEFHLLLADAANNRLLYHVQNTLQHMHRAFITQARSNRQVRSPLADELLELEAIYRAIQAHDVQAACQAMEAHLRTVEAQLSIRAYGSDSDVPDERIGVES
jgi:GntR family transcriptional repressor for pyruvate dehydrogenase complex